MCMPRFYYFSLYAKELNSGQSIWDKTHVLLRTSRGMQLGHIWNLKIWWEHHGNTLGARKKNKNPPLPPSKRKNLDNSWVYVEPSHCLHENFETWVESWGHCLSKGYYQWFEKIKRMLGFLPWYQCGCQFIQGLSLHQKGHIFEACEYLFWPKDLSLIDKDPNPPSPLPHPKIKKAIFVKSSSSSPKTPPKITKEVHKYCATTMDLFSLVLSR